MKKVLIRVMGLVVVLGGAWYGYRFVKSLPERQEHIATARVRRGDVTIRAYSRGELRAVRSVTLTAPNLFGTVQVTRLAPMGSLAREKDLIAEFDDSERRAALEETLLEVEQTDEQIKKARADLAIRDNQDQVSLLQTRYDVRRAELEVKRNPLISAIDARKNVLTLEEAQRRLKQLESDIKSRQEQGLASLAVLREQRNKSMIDVQREKQRIAQAKLLSPMTGLVAIKQNRGGFFMFGQQVPDIREGDTVQPGMPVADVLDLSELEVVAKVGELDRANLHEGQDVTITLDAVPEKRFKGRIKGMSGTASANVFSGDPAKKFDVIFSIDMRQLLSGLGMKPAEIEKIMATAAQNARKAPPSSAAPMAGTLTIAGPGAGPGGAPGGAPGGQPMSIGGPGMMPGGQAPAGGPPGMAEGGAPGEGRTRSFGGMRKGGQADQRSPEDQKKFREAMQKALGGKNMADLSAEERQGVMAKVREAMGHGKKGAGAPGMPALPGGGPADMMRFSALAGRFSDEDLANAKLPRPPGEDSGVQVLLRPGLLADVEIIVESMPNALHVPAQAVFEKEGKPVVYVQKGKRFEMRPVQLVKRSESVMVLAGGVEPNEVIAMADPFAARTSKKGPGDKKSGGNPMGAVPAGGGK